MPRYKLTVAYDGTDFCGWQKQLPHADSKPNEQTEFRAGDPPEIFSRGERMPRETVVGAGAAEHESGSEGREDAQAEKNDATARKGDDRTELRTVQGVVERAIRMVVRQPVNLMGASRTDSGVHAKGQVCAFTTIDDPQALMNGGDVSAGTSNGADGGGRGGGGDVPNYLLWGSGWPLARGTDSLLRAVNSRLPGDVLVRAAEVAEDSFDPVNGAERKAYSYTIFNSLQRPLWERRQALHVWHALDARRMNDAAQLFVGEHDFGGFATTGHGRATTVRTIFSCSVRATPFEASLPGEARAQLITIDICGSGFLWNMVRIIAGTMMEAGKSDPRRAGARGGEGAWRMSFDQIRRALQRADRKLAGPTAPAHGLCLEWIRYGKGGKRAADVVAADEPGK